MKELHIPLQSTYAQRNLCRTFPARVELGIHGISVYTNANSLLYFAAFPRRRSPITETTREVLFLFDWYFAHGYLRAFTSETHAQVSETARTGAAAGHSGESGRKRRHAPLRGALPLRGPHPSLHRLLV